MEDAIMVIAVTGIVCGTAIVWGIIGTIRAAIASPGRRHQNEVLQEIRALREEVKALRQQNTDVILGLDSAVHGVSRRLERVEGRAVTPVEEQQVAGRSR
jgi:hypothetical protein